MSRNLEKETILKLYEDNLNDIIWTHKIQATLMDNMIKKNKIFRGVKETVVGLSGFASAICIYFDEITMALIVNAFSSITIILDSIFKFCSYEEKIECTKSNVNELWFMKKELTMYKEYLKNDIVSWEEAKRKLEDCLVLRKEIYAKLEQAPNKIVNKSSSKLIKRKDEEINKEFFKEGE